MSFLWTYAEVSAVVSDWRQGCYVSEIHLVDKERLTNLYSIGDVRRFTRDLYRMEKKEKDNGNCELTLVNKVFFTPRFFTLQRHAVYNCEINFLRLTGNLFRQFYAMYFKTLTEIDPKARHVLASKNNRAYMRKHVMTICAETYATFCYRSKAFYVIYVIDTYLSFVAACFSKSVSNSVLAWPRFCRNRKIPPPPFSRRSWSSTRLSLGSIETKRKKQTNSRITTKTIRFPQYTFPILILDLIFANLFLER